MNPDIKAKWVAALRSGKYRQSRNRLREFSLATGEVYGYCCLGVLCDVVGADWQGEAAFFKGEGEEGILPRSVAKLAFGSVYNTNPRIPGEVVGEPTAICLSAMNDIGTSFAAIADLIEKHL